MFPHGKKLQKDQAPHLYKMYQVHACTKLGTVPVTFLDGVAGKNSQEKKQDSLEKGLPELEDWNNDRSSSIKQ